MTPKANRGKKRYFRFHQINKFCASKGTIKKGNTSLESLCTICRNTKLFFWYGKQYDRSSEDTEVIWDSAIPLLGVCSKESKIWADTCTLVYRAIIHNNKNVEATQESIKDDWISKIEHTCNRILFRFNEKGGFPGGSMVKNLPSVQETQKMQLQSLNWEDPLEEEMATHSNILAWEIPWTEEPGGPQSTGPTQLGAPHN